MNKENEKMCYESPTIVKEIMIVKTNLLNNTSNFDRYDYGYEIG